MARGEGYDFTVFGWEDYDQNRHRVGPTRPLPDSADPHGVLVRATSVNDPEDVHEFMVYTRVRFQTWAEWWVYIAAIMKSHGMELA